MNRELKLSLDELSVESFHITRPEVREGTVRAHETGQWDVSCGGSCADTCEPCNWETRGVQFSCYATCDFSCDNCTPPTDYWSCDYTCGPCGDYTPTRTREWTEHGQITG